MDTQDSIQMSKSAIDWENLCNAARDASVHAYCPYSQFPVGAAVFTEEGEIYAGCNVENASFGLSICAERNAVFQAISQGRRKIIAVAVYTSTSTPLAPCGACLQVLAEFGKDLKVRSICHTDQEREWPLAELLPQAFTKSNLGCVENV